MTTKLETRIREVAAKMEGKYWGTVPHSLFVEWDATWDVAEEIDPEDGSPCNEDSTDEEIEACIRYREDVADYEDEAKAYEESLFIEKVADESAPRIIEEAGAQKLTTPEEVHKIIVKLLTDPDTRKEIERDVRFAANELCYPGLGDANRLLHLKPLELEDLKEYGVDYGNLESLVHDGPDDYIPDVETAVRMGIVAGWAGGFLDACVAVNEKKLAEMG